MLRRGRGVRQRGPASEIQRFDAIGGWSKRAYFLQTYYACSALVEIDLYAGDGAAAHRRCEAEWPALVRSFLLLRQTTRVEHVAPRHLGGVVEQREHGSHAGAEVGLREEVALGPGLPAQAQKPPPHLAEVTELRQRRQSDDLRCAQLPRDPGAASSQASVAAVDELDGDAQRPTSYPASASRKSPCAAKQGAGVKIACAD